MTRHVRNSWPPVDENLADAIFGGSGISSHGQGVTVGWSVGATVGNPVGMDVRQIPLDASQTSDRQSLPLAQPSPTSHAGHPPPQSTSDSSPFWRPSVQLRSVGIGVGSGIGTAVGAGIGTPDGGGVGTGVGKGVGAGYGIRVGAVVGKLDGIGVGRVVADAVGSGEGAGDGDGVGTGDGAGVGENVSTDTDRTDADDIERRRPAASSSAAAKSTIAAVRLPSATDALSMLVTCWCAPTHVRCVVGRLPLRWTRGGSHCHTATPQ